MVEPIEFGWAAPKVGPIDLTEPKVEPQVEPQVEPMIGYGSELFSKRQVHKEISEYKQ